MAILSCHVRAIPSHSLIVLTTATLLELAKFCLLDTLELCGNKLQPGGQLETPGLVDKRLLFQ